MDAIVACIERTEICAGGGRVVWVLRGTRPVVGFSGYPDWTCVFGSITGGGDHFLKRTSLSIMK